MGVVLVVVVRLVLLLVRFSTVHLLHGRRSSRCYQTAARLRPVRELVESHGERVFALLLLSIVLHHRLDALLKLRERLRLCLGSGVGLVELNLPALEQLLYRSRVVRFELGGLQYVIHIHTAHVQRHDGGRSISLL